MVHADKPFLALVDGNKTLTYAEFAAETNDLAARIRASHRDRERLGLCINNSIEFVETFFAAILGGCELVLLNPASPDGEIDSLCERAGVKSIIFGPNQTAKKRSIKNVATADIGGGDGGLKATSNFHAAERVPGDTAFVIFSGGTTGRPTGCLVTHENLLSELFAMRDAHALPDDSVHLCVLPMFHTSALFRNLLIPFAQGSKVVIAPQFEPRVFWDWMDRHRVSYVQAVPSIIRILLDQDLEPSAAVKKQALFVGSASGHLDGKIAETFETRFGIPIAPAYGATETTCGICFNHPRDPNRRLDSPGRPISNMKLEIRDEAGNVLPPNTIGEIVVSGPAICQDYVYDEASQRKRVVGNTLYTEDIGYLDENGYLIVEGRLTDIIHRAGFKISPKEIENNLITLDDVTAAIVFGVPHPTLGEDIIAEISVREGVKLNERKIRQALKQRLSPYKIPTRILPLPSGFTAGDFKQSRNTRRRQYIADRGLLFSTPESEGPPKPARPAGTKAFLWGENVYLRPLLEDDLANETYLENLMDPEVHYLTHSGRFPQNERSIHAFWQGYQPPSGMIFAVCDRKTNVHVGNAVLRIDWIGRSAEFGRFIFKEYQGQVYSEEPLTLLMEYVFERLRLDRLWGGGANPASVPSLVRRGFTLEGRLRKHDILDGQRRDKFFVGMLSDDYWKIKRGEFTAPAITGISIPDHILAGIREAFEGAFQIDPAALTPATSPRDIPEWDSLGYVLLWNIIEEKFRVPISSSDIIAIRNVEDLAVMLMEKTGLKN
jgi:acyl-CoA synthetase (AMP-forming)/AMP-acid ligase II/RimJ/RimL family protein N-acetyltransferase/acyl carrier protein